VDRRQNAIVAENLARAVLVQHLDDVFVDKT